VIFFCVSVSFGRRFFPLPSKKCHMFLLIAPFPISQIRAVAFCFTLQSTLAAKLIEALESVYLLFPHFLLLLLVVPAFCLPPVISILNSPTYLYDLVSASILEGHWRYLLPFPLPRMIYVSVFSRPWVLPFLFRS